MSEGPKQSSVLFDQYMLWGVSFFLVGAIVFRKAPLVIVATFLLVISLIILVWKRKSLNRLVPSIHLNRSRVFSNDKIRISCTLKNDKWLPLVWLEWEQDEQKGITWNETRKGKYQIRFLWLLGYQQVSWEITGDANSRGVYSLGQVLLRSGDAFRFSEIEKTLDLKNDLYVYPKLIPVSVPKLPNILQWGTIGNKGGIMEDSSQVVGLREYQSGDEFRKIHWQSSAKTGTLQTWVHKPVLPKQLFLCIDVEGYSLLEPAQFEWFLSVIASAALAYHKQNLTIGHISNALDGQGNKISFSGPSKSISLILDTLAKMTTRVPEQGQVLAETILKGKINGPILYFCDRVEAKHVNWVNKNRTSRSAIIFYYHRKSKFTDLLPRQAYPMESLLS